jgi:hypothetical protein
MSGKAQPNDRAPKAAGRWKINIDAPLRMALTRRNSELRIEPIALPIAPPSFDAREIVLNVREPALPTLTHDTCV